MMTIQVMADFSSDNGDSYKAEQGRSIRQNRWSDLDEQRLLVYMLVLQVAVVVGTQIQGGLGGADRVIQALLLRQQQPLP